MVFFGGGLLPGMEVWGQCLQRECRGQPRLGGLGGLPQKLKPKTTLDASRKAFSDAECQVCATTTFRLISRYT